MPTDVFVDIFAGNYRRACSTCSNAKSLEMLMSSPAEKHFARKRHWEIFLVCLEGSMELEGRGGLPGEGELEGDEIAV